ncbi:MAG: chemotaxis protein CheB, partial [Pseudomonadota bacterium]
MKDSSEQPTSFIGIASSAGGLEAVSTLVATLKEGFGACYVIAQHISPNHTSLLRTLIERETRLPVLELKDPIAPASDTIYLVPPSADVILDDGLLTLVEPAEQFGMPSPSADRLFISLANEMGERSLAIVLSGTGSDGSYGVQAVREAGGITIAQDASSAKYDGMPVSAVNTGCVDLVLSPGEIGQHLGRILAVPRDLEFLKQLSDQPHQLTDLMHILLARTRIDFRDYKMTTVQRRIQRRMLALGIEDYDAYVNHCREHLDEADALFRDLLISVTRFFRDPGPFLRLRDELKATVEDAPDRTIRIWVPGCATGEEAYSIAILAAEALGGPSAVRKDRLQIFATDIDEEALQRCRRGVFPLSAANDIKQDYLEKYFDLEENRIVVKQFLKQVVIVSNHNMFQDPPFSSLDMVSLRNVLIYFNSSLQERVLRRVQYALRPNGLLFLGAAEHLGGLQADYEAVSARDRIYRQRLFRGKAKPSADTVGWTNRSAQGSASSDEDKQP